MSALFLFITILSIPYLCAAQIIPGAYLIEYAESAVPLPKLHLLSILEPLKHLFEPHHEYDSDIFRGVSLRLNDMNDDPNHPVLQQLMNDPSVGKIYPMHEVPRPQWVGDQQHHRPYDRTISQVESVQKQLKLTGKDVLVGILDTGVDYNHPALGGGLGKGHKIRFGYNMVKDDSKNIKPLAKDDPYDPCPIGGSSTGHGTHVAGIIAGYDPQTNFTGVAPDVAIAFWRIFGCTGTSSEDLVIKAMELAYKAGCDIINLSLGIDTAWGESAIATVADRLAGKGLIVVTVAGNRGPAGIFLQSSPGSGPRAIAVGSVDNDFLPAEVIDVSTLPGQHFLYQPSNTTKQFPNGTFTLVQNKEGGVISGCSSLAETIPSLNNTITLLVRDGKCGFDEKIATVAKKGAIGVLFYDPNAKRSDEIFNPATPANIIPSASIPLDLATELMKLKGPAEIILPNRLFDHPITTAGQVSDFSSVGPTYELELKPNIAGIGAAYSTLPLHIDNGWGIRRGTSMASPHVAGVFALMIQRYREEGKKVEGHKMLEQLQNHARLAVFQKQPDHPLFQGAGLVQPLDAFTSPVHISPAQISLNDTADPVKSFTFTISNDGNDSIEGHLEHSPSKSLRPYANATTFTASEPVGRGDERVVLVFSKQRVTIPPKSSVTIDVKVSLPLLDHHYQMYGGYVSLVQENKQVLGALPYFGVLGRMRDLPMLDKNYPYLAPTNNSKVMYTNDKVYTLDASKGKGQAPWLVYRLLTASVRVEIALLDTDQQVVGDVEGSPFRFMDRNMLTAPRFDNPVEIGNVVLPGGVKKNVASLDNGNYYVHFRVLKLFGNPDSPHDWEEWTSGAIHVYH